jgi:hypothetical protein
MQANMLTPRSTQLEKKTVCRSCRREAAVFEGVSQYTTIWLDDYLTERMREKLNTQLENISHVNWKDFSSHGILIGAFSTYLSMLHQKVTEVTSTTESWNEYLSDLKNSLFVTESLPEVFAQTKPTHCVVYNPLYPTNRMFTELTLKDSHIQYVGMSTSGFVPDRYSTISLYRSIQSSQTMVDSKTLVESMLTPLSNLEVKLVARQIGQLVRGKDPWVYTTPPTAKPQWEIKKMLGIENNLPVAVVLIGSPDETRSSAAVRAEFERVPSDELSNVQEFIEQSLIVAGRNPKVNFIFRLHPRLAPNKREALRSPDLDAIEKSILRSSSNVVVNSAGDGVGLYDVARIANFGINHASSAGVEFLALGIPVIQYDPLRLNAYPPGLGIQVSRMNQVSFQEAVAEALVTPISTQVAVPAWRWYAVSPLRSVTHKLWSIKPAASNETAVPKFVWLRRTIPSNFRERVARNRELWLRKKQINLISQTKSSGDWIEECVERISNFDNTIIWEPKAISRGDSLSINDEVAAVSSEIASIHQLIEQQ